MPDYIWEGETRSGDTKKGEMNGASEEFVRERLENQGIKVKKVKKKPTEININLDFLGVPLKSKVIFTRQLSTMIDSGLPIVQCLELLGNAEPHATFRKTIYDLKDSVEEGNTLAYAMRQHPRVFDKLYCSLVEAGEQAGILDTIMARLAVELEKSSALRRKVRGAFVYPVIVILIGLIATIILLYAVIPVFSNMFKEMGGGELPKPTQFVINLSDFIQHNILFILLGFVAIGGVFYFILKNETTREVVDRVMLKAPLFGNLVRKTAVARFTRTLGTMLAAGVPIVDALEIVAATAGNKKIEKSIYYVRERIAEGFNMVEPLMETGVFPEMVVQMIGVGESTGALDTMLGKIAVFYEEEVDEAVDALTSMMEPLLMVGLGGLVGGMLIAMYLPIFTMAGNISG